MASRFSFIQGHEWAGKLRPWGRTGGAFNRKTGSSGRPLWDPGGPNALRASISLVATGRGKAHEIVTHKFSLEQVEETLETVLNRIGGVLKAAITP